MEDKCLYCGDIIPEGRMICPICEAFPPKATSELDKAKKMLEEEYARAKNLTYVHNPLAYALYQVWKKVDIKHPHQDTDLTDKCGSCKWSVPCMFSTKGTFGNYVECQHPDKVWRHAISKKRQRTTPKCKRYERSENENT